MKYIQHGAEHGRIVIYFHGTPGAPSEGAIFDQLGKEHGLLFICLDRFSIDASITDGAYYQLLAKEISAIADGNPVHFIGFSIGAFVALQTCRHMNNRVKHLHLISAAAPLDGGNFLEQMAGKQVFKLARGFPYLFLLLSYGQKLLALLWPRMLFRLLFVSATGKDQILVASHEFQTNITNVLRSCFLGNIQGYVREIRAYVQPWKSTLSDISVRTNLWYGSDDNWSPIAMAKFLESLIPNCQSTEFIGVSHYSCLHDAVPHICVQIANDDAAA